MWTPLLQSIRHLQTAADHAARLLPFGYYLENKASFLESIDNRVRLSTVQSHEDRLIKITTKHTESHSASSDADPNLKLMLDCGMHYGHLTRRVHPLMHPFIIGRHSGIHIINLEKTLPMLRQACAAVRELASRSGKIIWVGTKPIAQRIVYECAMACEQYYVNVRWLGGTISNREHLLGTRSILPDMLIILDYPGAKNAIKEAQQAAIPVIAICDTDCDPRPITYPIPANDDSQASVELVGRCLAHAAWEGKQARSLGPHDPIIHSAQEFIRQTEFEKPHDYSLPEILPDNLPQ